MRTAYFDISFGVSGDMLVGALIDAGLDVAALTDGLARLGIDGWSVEPEKTNRHGISGTLAHINAREEHRHRTLSDIGAIVERAGFSETVRDRVMRVFVRLAEAEARVHGIPAGEVHFHEVGALDSIIDVCAFCIALDLLRIGSAVFGDFHFGTGTIRTQHGEIPVPVPAVVELCRGFRGVMTGRAGELVTPTGAAILTALGSQVASLPAMKIDAQGFGFGSRDYPFTSYTRVILTRESPPAGDIIVQIECSIDDMNPQIYPHLLSRLFEIGVLDAYLTPVHMKKGRPGLLLTVVCAEQTTDAVRGILYAETTTLGLRSMRVAREKIDRSFETVTVDGCDINMKIGTRDGVVVNVSPEFDDCKSAADRTGKALKTIMARARHEYENKTR